MRRLRTCFQRALVVGLGPTFLGATHLRSGVVCAAVLLLVACGGGGAGSTADDEEEGADVQAVASTEALPDTLVSEDMHSDALTQAQDPADALASNMAPPDRDESGSAYLGPLAVQSHYDARVIADRPVVYLAMAGASSATEMDLAGSRLRGVYKSRSDPVRSVRMPNGDLAAVFNGEDQYLEYPDTDDLSVTTTGVLTFEAWIRPDATRFPHAEGSGYVHWMGKGEKTGRDGQQEWVARMYSNPNSEGRKNRISGYAFNPGGGLGSGSYFQDAVKRGRWIHYVFVINARDVSAEYPMGYTKIYKNGRLRDTDSLEDYGIRPRNGTAPFRVGTTAGRSFFLGAVGKVAVYPYELSMQQAAAHYRLICGKGC